MTFKRILTEVFLRVNLLSFISHVLKNKTFSFLALIQKTSSINKNEGNEFKQYLIK